MFSSFACLGLSVTMASLCPWCALSLSSGITGIHVAFLCRFPRTLRAAFLCAAGLNLSQDTVAGLSELPGELVVTWGASEEPPVTVRSALHESEVLFLVPFFYSLSFSWWGLSGPSSEKEPLGPPLRVRLSSKGRQAVRLSLRINPSLAWLFSAGPKIEVQPKS